MVAALRAAASAAAGGEEEERHGRGKPLQGQPLCCGFKGISKGHPPSYAGKGEPLLVGSKREIKQKPLGFGVPYIDTYRHEGELKDTTCLWGRLADSGVK